MFFSLGQIVAWLIQYKYLILFPIAVLEGPIISVLAGFLSSLGKMNFFVAWAVVILGDIVGDLLFYGFGRYGGRRFFDKYGHYFGITADRVIKAEKFFDKHSGKTLLFGKWTHSLGMVILVAAGATRTNLSKFILYNLIGTIPKSLAFMIIGFYFGSLYGRIDNYITYFSIIMVAVVVLFAVSYIFTHKYVKKYFDTL